MFSFRWCPSWRFWDKRKQLCDHPKPVLLYKHHQFLQRAAGLWKLLTVCFFWSVSKIGLQRACALRPVLYIWSQQNIHHCLLQAVPRKADRKHQPALCCCWDTALQLLWDREIDPGQDRVYPFSARTVCGALILCRSWKAHPSCVAGWVHCYCSCYLP